MNPNWRLRPCMADMDALDRARKAVSDRAELPGMSLMEHLEELRRRIINSAMYLFIGMIIGWCFRVRLYGIIKKPLDDLHLDLYFNHPTDGLNLYLKTALVGGAIIASPFILYQIWLFISPGMYQNEKKYVWPFMTATVGLFLCGAWFGYHYVLENAVRVLVFQFATGSIHCSPSTSTPGSFSPSFSASASASNFPSSSFFSRSSASSTQIPVAPLPLCNPRHLRRCRNYLSHAGPFQHVPLRQPHALSLLLWSSHRMVCPSRPPQAEGGVRCMISLE